MRAVWLVCAGGLLWVAACVDSSGVTYPGCTDGGGCEDASLVCCSSYCMTHAECVMQSGSGGGTAFDHTATGGGESVGGGGGGGGGSANDGGAAGGGTGGSGGGVEPAAGGGSGGGGGASSASGGGSGTGGGLGSSCNPTNCAGCCSNGACVALSSEDDAHCGLAGLACSMCGPMTNCTLGLCAPMCGPMSCPNGCCENDFCHAQPDDTACGGGGHMCKTCNGMKHCQQNEDGNGDFSCK